VPTSIGCGFPLLAVASICSPDQPADAAEPGLGDLEVVARAGAVS
jgi:hypothetical protein